MKNGGFSVWIDDFGEGVAIRCSGELDLSTREELRKAIDFCLKAGPLFLHVDCREVTFMASAGLDVLLYAQGRGRSCGTVVQVSMGAAGQRLLEVLGCSRLEEMDNPPRVARRTLHGIAGGLRGGWPPRMIFHREMTAWLPDASPKPRSSVLPPPSRG